MWSSAALQWRVMDSITDLQPVRTSLIHYLLFIIYHKRGASFSTSLDLPWPARDGGKPSIKIKQSRHERSCPHS